MKISRAPLKNTRTLTCVLFMLLVFAAQGTSECWAQSSNGAPTVVQAPSVVVVQEAPQAAQPQSNAAPQPANGARDGTGKKTPRPVLGSINGHVVGEAGEPLPGVAVYAVAHAFNPNSFNYDTRGQHSATADDDGNFSIGGLEPGLYGIGASMSGYVSEADALTGRAADVYRPGDTVTVRLVKGGAITGTVADLQGQPLIATSVIAYRVRDLDGRTSDSPFNFGGEGSTDDRGIYRIYGLRPGIYVVVANGSVASPFGLVSTNGDVPTFYPSSTRDTAAEVSVHAGQDTSGIDIRYRDDQQGRRVTGHVEMPDVQPSGEVAVSISLTYASSGIQAGNAYVMPNSTDRSFSLDAIPDGDYDIQASGGSRNGLASTSPPQRISVRGADVTGLRLTLAPLASVSGTLVIEPASETERASDACKDRRSSLLPQETLISAVADRSAQGAPLSRFFNLRDSSPDASGAFMLRNIAPGRYRLAVRHADESLYVRSIEIPGGAPASTSTRSSAAAPTRTAAAAAARSTTTATQRENSRELFDIRPGQQLSGINIRLAEGAAGLSGHVTAAEGASLPPLASLRVHLLPAEREQTDNTLRFYETTPAPDGSFSFKNLAPGRYLIVARSIADPSDASPRPASLDADSRAKLRRDAEATNITVELQSCQRTNGFTLPLSPLK